MHIISSAVVCDGKNKHFARTINTFCHGNIFAMASCGKLTLPWQLSPPTKQFCHRKKNIAMAKRIIAVAKSSKFKVLKTSILFNFQRHSHPPPNISSIWFASINTQKTMLVVKKTQRFWTTRYSKNARKSSRKDSVARAVNCFTVNSKFLKKLKNLKEENAWAAVEAILPLILDLPLAKVGAASAKAFREVAKKIDASSSVSLA